MRGPPRFSIGIRPPPKGDKFIKHPQVSSLLSRAVRRNGALTVGNFYPVLGKKVSIVSFCPSAQMARSPYLSDMSVLARNLLQWFIEKRAGLPRAADTAVMPSQAKAAHLQDIQLGREGMLTSTLCHQAEDQVDLASQNTRDRKESRVREENQGTLKVSKERKNERDRF